MRPEQRRLLAEALGLKALPRAGWVRAGIPGPESVAAHSWSMAFAATVLCPEHLDRLRVLELCLVHDLPEVQVGDLTPHDGISKAEKQRLELSAAQALFAHEPRHLALWQEYEAGATPEACFVKALDKLDMALQAEHYQGREGIDTIEFIASARRNPDVRRWLDED